MVRIGWGRENDDFPEELSVSEKGISFRSAAYGTRFELFLPGRHNALNALMAAAVGRSLGLSEEAIAEVSLRAARRDAAGDGRRGKRNAHHQRRLQCQSHFGPRRHRLARGPGAGEGKWVLLGDMAELGGGRRSVITGNGRYAVAKGVRRVYTFGDRGNGSPKGLRRPEKGFGVEHFVSLEDAVTMLRDQGTKTCCFW